MDESRRERAASKKLRVVFPDGDVICYTSATETFVETLKKIGPDALEKVKMVVCHLPMISREVYPRFKEYMRPIGGGWYVNTQGDTANKYMQLASIAQQLGLELTIDVSSDFKGQRVHRGSKGMPILEVTFPDGTTIGDASTLDTFLQCVWKIGIDKVERLKLEYGGKPVITTDKEFNGQIQVDNNKWLLVPGSTKDKVKLLKVINIMLHLQLKVFYL
ncbi:MAG: hypothetical protein LKI87_02290 [Prevotella sp.]|jgi:hypothetical protein|nr:hypothetical protein [Prevotella sp.]MCI1684357.1 hypothetical protein [Prevotella sp.]MCI1801933.1 hypothetical protein [Prevotella sp.]MCI1815726.1 hypothetical protein [Prevotella sp.]MCI1847647.1 hypothetical protein [Prevotella sp.]